MKVWVPKSCGQKCKDYLAGKGYEVICGQGLTEDAVIADIADADGAMCHSVPYTRRVMTAAKKLKVIGRLGVGTDNIDLAAAEELGIWVGVTKGANANAVAEHAMSLILACAKNLRLADTGFRNGDWDFRFRCSALELRGKTLGILGLGAIGSRVAVMAHMGFGMRVIGYDPAPAAICPDYAELMPDMDSVLRQADIVSIHVPVLPETENMIDARALSLMKPTAYFINSARGALVDENALYEALRDGVIAGAAVDVFKGDKPSPDHPFFRLDNIILTPHYASFTEEATEMTEMMGAMAVDAVLSGGEPEFPVTHPKNPRK